MKKKKKGIQKMTERHICSVEKSYHLMICFLVFMPVFVGQKMTSFEGTNIAHNNEIELHKALYFVPSCTKYCPESELVH